MTQKNSPTGVVGQYLATPGRAWFDRSFTHLASYPIGKQCPDAVVPLTGNTTVKLDMVSMLQTNPTPTSVFDSARCTVRVFFYPQRLCVRGLQNDNYMELDEIEEKQLPAVTLDFPEPRVVMYGSILNRLGLPASVATGNTLVPLNPKLYFDEDTTKTASEFSAFTAQKLNLSSLIGYYDICSYFLANPYDTEIPFDTPERYLNKDASGNIVMRSLFDFDNVTYYNLKDFQNWIELIKGINSSTESINIPSQSVLLGDSQSFAMPIARSFFAVDDTFITSEFPQDVTLSAFSWSGNPLYNVAKVLSTYSSTTGLWPSTYLEDYQSTWFDVDDINSLNAVELSYETNGTPLSEVRIKQSIWNRMLRSVLRGKRLSDWMDIQFGKKLALSNHPIMVGADSFEITFDDIIANSSGSAGQGTVGNTGFVPLGAAAGRGGGYGNTNRRNKKDDRTITFTTQEPGYLFIIRDIVPHVSYPDARPRHFDYTVMADFPLPMYSGKTFQDLAVSDIMVTSSPDYNDTVVGKQPIYYDHMISGNTLGGLLQSNLYDSYTFKRISDINDMSVENSETNARHLRSTYVLRGMYDFQFTDWSQNNGENIFIKTYYNLRCYQPLDKQVVKTRL